MKKAFNLSLFLLAFLILFTSCVGNIQPEDDISYLEFNTDDVKTVYFVGEQIDFTGLQVIVHYKDGSSKSVTDYTVTPNFKGNTSKAGSYEYFINYKGYETKIVITVSEKPVNLKIEAYDTYKEFSRYNNEPFYFGGNVYYICSDNSEIEIQDKSQLNFYINERKIKNGESLNLTKGGIYNVVVECNGIKGNYEINVSHLINYDYSNVENSFDQSVIKSVISQNNVYEFYEGKGITQLPQSFETYKYFFGGWYDKSDFNNTPLTMIPENTNEDITLYGKFYMPVINYELNGGQFSETENVDNYISKNDYDYLDGKSLPGEYEISRNGYGFKGWSLTPQDTGNYIKRIKSDKDVTVYAIWKIYNYGIDYSLKSDSTNSIENPDTYTVEDEIIFQPATRPGYEFLYWKDSDGNRVDKIQKGTSGYITLSPVWSQNKCNITYMNLENGDNSYNPDYYVPGMGLSLSIPTRKGYTFEGWYKNPSFSGERITSISEYENDDVILYAKWSLNYYSIFYNFTNSAVSPGSIDNPDNPKTYTIEDEIELKPAHISGCDFKYWRLDGSNEPFTKIQKGTCDFLELYAVYTPKTYNITYVLGNNGVNGNNPSTYTYGTGVSLEPAERPGYEFQEWNFVTEDNKTFSGAISQTCYGDLTVIAQWKAINYKINYQMNGVNSYIDAPEEYSLENPVTLPVPLYRGYEFNGWYLDAGFNDEVQELSLVPQGDSITVYAKWTPITYKVNYELNGGTLSSANPSTFTLDDSEVVLNVPYKKGYVFVRWDTHDKLIHGDNIQNITKLPYEFYDYEITLYAHFTPADDIPYKVNYYLENLDGEYDLYSSIDDCVGTTNTRPDFEQKEFEHFSYDDWNTEDNSGYISAEGDTVVNVYYKREIITFTLINDGKTEEVKGKYGDVVNAETPTSSDKVFIGWDPALPSYFEENRTFTAQWKNKAPINISVTIAPESQMQITKSQNGNVITLTAEENLTNCRWYVDSKLYSAGSNSVELDISSWTKGSYEVFVTAMKNSSLCISKIYITKE